MSTTTTTTTPTCCWGQAAGRLERVYCTETRPYNQGARLTAFELVQDKLPGTLVTDSMASFLMATKGLDAVVVGADRIAGNGDTANKIGTYQLVRGVRVACRHAGMMPVVSPPKPKKAADPATACV